MDCSIGLPSFLPQDSPEYQYLKLHEILGHGTEGFAFQEFKESIENLMNPIVTYSELPDDPTNPAIQAFIEFARCKRYGGTNYCRTRPELGELISEFGGYSNSMFCTYDGTVCVKDVHNLRVEDIKGFNCESGPLNAPETWADMIFFIFSDTRISGKIDRMPPEIQIPLRRVFEN